MKVRIFAQRHGERDGDKLTQQGIEQIRTSKKLSSVRSVNFSAYYASPKNRTRQTATLFASDDSDVQISYGLYIPLSDSQIDAVWGGVSNQKALVHEWFRNLPRNWGARMREQLLAAFEEMARETAAKYPGASELNIYACGHSATLELALPDAAQETPLLGVSEFIIFIFELTGKEFTLKNTEIIRR